MRAHTYTQMLVYARYVYLYVYRTIVQANANVLNLCVFILFKYKRHTFTTIIRATSTSQIRTNKR